MYQITLFHNIFDNKTDKVIKIETWDKFRDFFSDLNKKYYENKSDAPLISPAVYKPNSTRANANVVEWSPWFALDVDDLECGIEEVEDVIHSRFNNWDYICHSTGSCTHEKPKCRVILRSSGPIEHDRIKPFWWAINSHVGNLGDKQTKDLSRLFYVPGTVRGSVNFMFHNSSGNAVEAEPLIRRYPYIQKTGNAFLDALPEGIRNQVIEYRKQQLTNTEVNWTSYRDCKYWPKRSAEEYKKIVDGGWYAKFNTIMVAIACSAIKDKYPITPQQIAALCREFDRDTGNWYEKRPFEVEAAGAINYAFANGVGQ